MATAEKAKLPSLRHFTVDAEHPPGDAPAAGFSDEDAERLKALSDTAVKAAEKAEKAEKEDKSERKSR